MDKLPLKVDELLPKADELLPKVSEPSFLEKQMSLVPPKVDELSSKGG